MEKYTKISNCLNCNQILTKDKNKYCSRVCYHNYVYKHRYRWNIDISDELHQILEGLLLSDGSLEVSRTSHYPRFDLSQSDKNLDYTKFMMNQLNLTEDRIKYKSKYNKVYQKTYGSYSLTTLSSPTWEPYFQRWYSNNKKIIPKDFVITPISLMHAFLGDGCYSHYKNSYKDYYRTYYRIILYLESYTEEEIISLIQKIESKINIKCNFNWHKQKTGIYPQIIINKKKSIEEFFNYIGPSPVKCYEYKFPLICT